MLPSTRLLSSRFPSLSWTTAQSFGSKNSRVCRAAAVGGSLNFFYLYPGTKNNQGELWKAQPHTWPRACPRRCPCHISLPKGKAQPRPEGGRPPSLCPSPAPSAELLSTSRAEVSLDIAKFPWSRPFSSLCLETPLLPLKFNVLGLSVM